MLRFRTCTADDSLLLVHALNECLYQGYRFRVVMTPERFAEDSRIHDVDLAASYVALKKGHPVGVTLVARRGDRAWIAGMGVHPSLRHQGVGSELMHRTQRRLRSMGVGSIALEVLVENEAARRCYLSAGFVAQRRLYCFRGTVSRIPWSWRASKVVKRSPRDILADYPDLHVSSACWQRELDTLRQRADELRGLAATQGRRIVATLLYSENAVADVGVPRSSPRRDRPIQEMLLSAFGQTHPFAIVNVPNDDPLCHVMHEAGFEVYAEQLDMLFQF